MAGREADYRLRNLPCTGIEYRSYRAAVTVTVTVTGGHVEVSFRSVRPRSS